MAPFNHLNAIQSWVTASPVNLAISTTLLASLLALIVLADRFFDFLPTSSHAALLRGPPHASFLTGHHSLMHAHEPLKYPRMWRQKYGTVYQVKGFYGARRIMVQDQVAIRHILMRPNDFPRTAEGRKFFKAAFGKGVIAVEGDDHARQRRILVPAFSHATTKKHVPVFDEIAKRLVARWTKKVEADGKGEAIFDILPELNLYALDGIGKAGFGMDFNTLESKQHRFLAVIRQVSSTTTPWKYDFKFLAKALWKSISTLGRESDGGRSKGMEERRRKMQVEAEDMIRERRAQVELGDDEAGDVLTLMIKSNLNEAVKFRLSDEEIVGQLVTFLFAGMGTTSTGLSWTLQILADHPDIQQRLRHDVREVLNRAREEGATHLSERELDSMQYLDCVTRESLRYRSPVAYGVLSVNHQTSIPLSKPITLRNGREVNELVLDANSELVMSRSDINTTEDIWGEDGTVFRPERWLEDPNAGGDGGLKSASVWSNISSFSGGPRSCIGFRFAVQEFKTALALLIDAFEFFPSGQQIEGRANAVTRPIIVGREQEGWTMPLGVRKAPA